MATIKDVAASAGVSYSTVSHVINKTRPISEQSRTKVEAAIRQLNYVPSAVARSLRHQATSTIGLLIPNNTNPFFSELAHGIEEGCYLNDYSVILCNSDDDPTREETHLRVLLEKRIDGLIVGSTGDDQPLARSLRQSGVPLVMVDREIPGLKADLVQVDHTIGGYLAARHLVDLGHRGMGCIAGPSSAVSSAERLQGYKKALRVSALPCRSEWIIESDFTTEGGYKAATILVGKPDLTAIFACNDLMAIGVLRYAAEAGLRVPRDLSVIGFDGIELGRYVYPALTTISQSIRKLGKLAAVTLIRRISRGGKGRLRRLVLPPHLVVRESTSPLSRNRSPG
jgi:LacI family transcriptional regulator